MSQVTPGKAFSPVSNKQFLEEGLKKKIQYQITLSMSRNSDFVVKHPNELKAKNADWKKEIIARVNKEHDVTIKIQQIRLAKRTGERRL